MEDLVPLLILLAVAALLSGPISLIVAVVALKRIEAIRRKLSKTRPAQPEQELRQVASEPAVLPETVSAEHVASPVPEQPASVDPVAPHRGAAGLEQRIGTRWVLIAGIITVIFAVAFFLKYAYDNEWIGPLGRVVVAAIAGLLALAVGEVTRRRGYDVVAKGVTAMGFAILYATVFAAHRWYALIDSGPAFAMAIGITAAAMLYAVVVDEVVVAVLSLVGGYVTPVVLSAGENLPNPLFSYVLIVSAGAMLCAYWRKWGIVNIIAFLGTYLLYTGWFERFYRPAMGVAPPVEPLGAAAFWLTVFFFVYLVLPVLHTLVQRVHSQVQDIVLVLANAAVVFYYLWTMLSDHHETSLALASLGMGAAHLGLMGLVFVRCRADGNLRNALLLAGLAFITLAVPIYFEVYTIVMLWAVEALVLAAAGLRYRNELIQIAAGTALALALGELVADLPMHDERFRLVLNRPFLAWCCTAAAVLAAHVLYRLDRHLDARIRNVVVQATYAAGLLLSMIAITMELWHQDDLNIAEVTSGFFVRQMILVFAVFLFPFAVRPISPPGRLGRAAVTAIAIIGALFLLAMYNELHNDRFQIFLNDGFLRSLVLVAAVFAAAWLVRRVEREMNDGFEVSMAVAVGGILALWLVLTEEIWFFYRLRGMGSWRLPAHMFISVTWAIYATVLMGIGFWRRLRPLRYIALGIFLLLLAKMFLVDTRTLETVYRIAGFLATGLALVGVSYLYQYLKKTGFFEAI